MLTYNPEFVENDEYAYAVGKIRAMETKLIGESGYNSLISSPPDRFQALFSEITGLRSGESTDFHGILGKLEDSFTGQFYMIKSLIIEDEIKRLISLEYDYELLKFIIKAERNFDIDVPTEVSRRSNYSYPLLKTLLEFNLAIVAPQPNSPSSVCGAKTKIFIFSPFMEYELSKRI